MREIADIELAIQGGTEKIESLGEQGKVEESMREMAAIEALKSEKAEKMVRVPQSFYILLSNIPLARARKPLRHFWRVRSPEVACL